MTHESTKILIHTSMSVSSTFNIENDPQNTQTENGDVDQAFNNPFVNVDPELIAKEEREMQMKYLNRISYLLFFQTLVQIIQIVASIMMVVSVSAYIAIINIVFSLLCIGENIIAHQQLIIINLACVTAEVALGFYYVVMTILDALYLADLRPSGQSINIIAVVIYCIMAICAIAIHCCVINHAGFAFQHFMPNVPVPGTSVKYMHEIKSNKTSSLINNIDDTMLLVGRTHIGSSIYLQSQQLRNLAARNVDVKQISIIMGEHDRRKAVIVNKETVRRGAFKDTSMPEAQSGAAWSASYTK